MSTILLFKEVADTLGVRITTDTNQELAMTVTLRWNFFSSAISANLGSISTTHNRNMKSQNKTITLITIPLLIILILVPSRKIQNP